MKVVLLNKEEVKQLFSKWGETSSVCYASNTDNTEKIGKFCLRNEHFSGSRDLFFRFHISNVSRDLSLQLNRHEIGVVKNQLSQRYVNQLSMPMIIPPEMVEFQDEIQKLYNRCLDLYEDFINCGVSKSSARYILPGGIATEGIWCFTLEALINFTHKRLCTRADWEINYLAQQMRDCVLEILPELQPYLVSRCEYLTWCPEENGCGRKPSKEALNENRNSRIKKFGKQ